MPLSYRNLTGAPVQDYELVDGQSTVNVKFTVTTIAANSSTTQASGTVVPTTASNVAVSSGGAGYSIVMPPAVPGFEIDIVLVTAANTVKVYPNPIGTGDIINALGANNAITMGALTSATFLCFVAGQWYTSPRVPS